MLKIFTIIADYFTFNLMGLEKGSHIAESFHFFVEDTLKIFFLIFFMSFLVSFVRSKLNPEKIREYLKNKPKWLVYFLASSLGAITPFCSCSSIPLFIGFIEAGIPFSVTIAFLITSPLINEVAVVVFADALGLTLTATYIISGMAVGIIGGFVMEKLKLSRYVEGYVYDIKMGNLETDEEKLSFKQELKIALRYSLSIFKRIWLFVIIGIGLGASIHGFVPQEFFTENLGKDNILSVPLAVLSGIPLYSNATGIVPIAKALIEKGMAIGTVLAMMMSVVAISLPEMIILRQVLKPRLIFFFALYLFIAFVVLGYFYNYIFYLK